MKGGKAFQDVRLQAAQRLAALIRIFETRNGAEADRLAQPSRRAPLVDRHSRHGCNLKLLRGTREHIEREHAGENEDCRDQQQCDIADYSDQSAHRDYLSLGRFAVGCFFALPSEGISVLGLAAFPVSRAIGEGRACECWVLAGSSTAPWRGRRLRESACAHPQAHPIAIP